MGMPARAKRHTINWMPSVRGQYDSFRIRFGCRHLAVSLRHTDPTSALLHQSDVLASLISERNGLLAGCTTHATQTVNSFPKCANQGRVMQ